MHFHLAATDHTPEVQINLAESFFLLRGVCFPENASELFEPVVEFLAEHLPKSSKNFLNLHLELTYLNSAAKKSLLQLVNFLLDRGIVLRVVLYQGTEEDELEDYEGLFQFWQRHPQVELEWREGYYQS